MQTLLRGIVVIVLVGVVAFLIVGFWPAGWSLREAGTPAEPGVGTSGRIDTERVREQAAELGEKAAVAAQKVQETLEEASVTTKIKAKMALDDTLKARAIDVTTSGSTVTVSGRVPSEEARERALALARETEGVTTVIDRLAVVPGS